MEFNTDGMDEVDPNSEEESRIKYYNPSDARVSIIEGWDNDLEPITLPVLELFVACAEDCTCGSPDGGSWVGFALPPEQVRIIGEGMIDLADRFKVTPDA